jgi:hypothetical protein
MNKEKGKRRGVYREEEGKKEKQKQRQETGNRKNSTHTGAGDEPQLASLVGEKDCASLLLLSVEGRWKLLLLLLLASCWRHVSYSGDDSLHVAPTDGELADMVSKDVLKEVIMSMSMFR